jgi:membrane protein implicated in regulation of membrane protease activity
MHGEIWKFETKDLVQQGDEVTVVSVSGLTLIVKKKI